ncbi:6-hydroxymethylpterin diphosphokinase MptE-like protein [Moritella marina]|uniref:6-hydroxymethylpterin diphosphokinase MptE-like protein n=1 Tax=Moritella marina TaxID=90736 RepID=UPI003704A29B
MLKRTVKSLIIKKTLPYSLFEMPFWYPLSDRTKISKMKDKFKGKRCVIIGNGPSLNKIDLNLLKNEYTFGVNSIFLKENEGFKPTFYTVEDCHVMNDNKDRINDFNTQYRFFPTRYKKEIRNRKNTYFFNMNEGFYKTFSPYENTPRFSVDAADQLFCGQSVTIINLQLAYFLGFTEIYLIGMDFSYVIPESAIIERGNITSTEDDPNHFDSSYFGAGKKWHDPMPT